MMNICFILAEGSKKDSVWVEDFKIRPNGQKVRDILYIAAAILRERHPDKSSRLTRKSIDELRGVNVGGAMKTLDYHVPEKGVATIIVDYTA